MKHVLAAALCATCASAAWAAEPAKPQSLSDQIDGLNAPAADQGQANAEKLYVVQNARSGLGGVFELQAGGGYNATSNVNVASTEMEARFVYHMSNRLFAAISGSKVQNNFTASAQDRMNHDGIYPDVAFVKDRADATVGFNAIYGKARVTSDSVFYFNQYVALGGGFIDETNTLQTYREKAAVGDLGVSFWFGNRVSFAVGAKGYRFKEDRIETSSTVTHVVGYANAGLLLGGGAS